MEHSNVLLVLMCLDLKDPNPLRSRSGLQVFLDDEDNRYQLLVAVLDPAQRATSAPVMGIKLDRNKRRTYNAVLRQFQEISARFYSERGFIDEPASYTEDRQTEVLDAMSAVGRDIYDLFRPEAEGPYFRLAIREWLDKLLGASDAVRSRHRPIRPVTILTNDFGIPWFWLNNAKGCPFFCEVCSLGLLQLSAVDRATGAQQAPPGQRDKTYEALLIEGSTTLPFQDEELDMITALLSDSDSRAARTFTAQRAKIPADIYGLLGRGEDSLLDDFRIVHFSGHYSGQKLLVGDKPVAISALYPVLSGSLLVLDGCSSAGKLTAWADVEGLTSSLINKGALGCVVTVLPVKHDPIISRVLWGAFYRELRRGSSTVGQALAKARGELRDHFAAIGSHNPAWAVYQLIGSPAVPLCDEEDEGDG
jgi:hypothetical protein